MRTPHEKEAQQIPRKQGITIVNKEALHNWLLFGTRMPTFAHLAAHVRHAKRNHTVARQNSLLLRVSNSQPEAS